MYHSISIGEKNTWDDWRLIPASRPLFNPPTVKTNIWPDMKTAKTIMDFLRQGQK